MLVPQVLRALERSTECRRSPGSSPVACHRHYRSSRRLWRNSGAYCTASRNTGRRPTSADDQHAGAGRCATNPNAWGGSGRSRLRPLAGYSGLFRVSVQQATPRPTLAPVAQQGDVVTDRLILVIDSPILSSMLDCFGRAREELYGYDPDKARELLTQAGYPNGFS